MIRCNLQLFGTCLVTEPVSETVLEPLVHLLVISDLEVQKAASHALSNLALHGAGKWFVKWCEFHFAFLVI